jgi:23S rRNA (cytosine1962-C5)-methyltransferase
LVEVRYSLGNARGLALYGAKTIALKFLTFGEGPIDSSFFRGRFERALAVRRAAGLLTLDDTNCFRLFFGESDGVPGLIIDRYNEAIVFQIQEPGLLPFEELIVAAIREAYPQFTKTLYHKKAEGEGIFYEGTNGEGEVSESGMRLLVNWVTGQKTGFFLDQRENRSLLRRYVYRKRVLNCFCYTGGFSISALAGGAERVVSVDSSDVALQILEQNVIKAGKAEHSEAVKADVFHYLENLKEEFDLIIVDPPAFVKHRDALERGLKGYRQLNIFAFEKVKTPGIVFTFSCSQQVSRADFKRVVSEAAVAAKKKVSILHELHQAPCHPVALAFPESEYLKGYVLRVEDYD